jgi:NADH dehydrogenase [ubiquinone] 1 alpha subcomplex assembly factor 6
MRSCSHDRPNATLRERNIFIPVRSVVSNEDMGKLRIQFFRDGLNAVLAGGGEDMRFPIIQVLAEVSGSEPRFDVGVLHTLVNARERDLAYPSFKTVSSLCTFARDVQSPLIHAHAHCLIGGRTPPPELPVACSYAGEAVGLAVLLRGTPAHAAMRLTYVPTEVSTGVGASAADLLSGGGAAVSVFELIAGAADRALLLAEEALRVLPSEVRPAFWGLSLPRIYLSRLKRAGCNPFDESLQTGMLQTYPLALQLSLLKARLLRQ